MPERTQDPHRGPICVVGGGSSGITAVRNLMDLGFDVDCFEREDSVGGNWNFGKPNSRVYESTHLISSKPFTGYPDFPFPDEFPDYPHHSQVLEYLQSYSRHFGVDDRINFSTSVDGIVPASTGGWNVTISKANGGGEPETRRYAAVVIANGHNWFPKIPDYPGRFTGEVIHSAEYKSASQLEGKRVLVVGGGNTGCDIAVDAAGVAGRAFHSTRRGYWYAPKYTWGRPADQVSDVMFGAHLPSRLIQAAFQLTLRLTVGDHESVGLKKPDHRILETHPIVNSHLVPHVRDKLITPKDDIESFDGRTVHFVDGTAEEVDMVVYATGYLIRFPFMDHSLLNWENDRPRLFMHVFHPQRDDLFVIGLIQPDSGQFKLVHWQAYAVAAFLAAAPEARTRFRHLMADRFDEHLGANVAYKDSSRHHVEINHMQYLRRLEDVIRSLEHA